MSIEATLYTALQALVGGRLYINAAPPGTARPYATYQLVGGAVVGYLEGGPAPARISRVQINVWHDTALAAHTLMRQIEDVLLSAPHHAEALGALTSRHEPITQSHGAQQDFRMLWTT